MPPIDSPTKDFRLVEAGHRGALARWGPPRRVRLDDFEPEERAAILAAIEAKRAAKVVESEKAAAENLTPATAAPEGHGDDRPAS